MTTQKTVIWKLVNNLFSRYSHLVKFLTKYGKASLYQIILFHGQDRLNYYTHEKFSTFKGWEHTYITVINNKGEVWGKNIPHFEYFLISGLPWYANFDRDL